MQAINTRPVASKPSFNRNFLAGLSLVIFALLAVYGYNAYNAYRAHFLPSGITVLSRPALEAQYGLRVNLVAVTAAGGLLDIRLKVVDSAKAGALLKVAGNYPTIFYNGKTLSVPEDSRPAVDALQQGANLFLLFPNAGGVVRSGDPVTIVFGKIAVEAIPAQ